MEENKKEESRKLDANEKLGLLLEFHSQMADKNHFELLGVPEDVDDSGVRSAYFELLKLYNADFFHHITDPEKCKAIEEVNSKLRTAYDTLMKEPARQAYLASLHGLPPEESEKEFDIADIFEAENLSSRAQLQMEKGDFKVALGNLEKAFELDPKSPEIPALLAYARLMESEVDESGKRDPKLIEETRAQLEAACLELPYGDFLRVCLGNLEKAENHPEKALEWFKDAVNINPDNMWAKRELRMSGAIEDPAPAPEPPAGAGLLRPRGAEQSRLL